MTFEDSINTMEVKVLKNLIIAKEREERKIQADGPMKGREDLEGDGKGHMSYVD